MARRHVALSLAIIATAALGACAGDTNPVRDVAVGAGFGRTVPQRPDFVEASRPAGTDYMPVGVAAPPRALAKKTPDQVKAMEAELDGTRTGHGPMADEARRLAATPPPAPVKLDADGNAEPVPGARRRR
ncbi:hypothetical protein [Salinarimonas soli]|nr:hypothetical protein [Salinarimonas soli]